MRPSRDLAVALPGRVAPSWADLPAGSPWRGSLAASSQVRRGSPAWGLGLRAGEGSPGGRGAEPLIGIRRTRAGRGALRVKQGRATGRLGLACAPGRIPGGAGGPPTARPALHAAETDEKIKNPL